MGDRYCLGGGLHRSSDRLFAAHKGLVHRSSWIFAGRLPSLSAEGLVAVLAFGMAAGFLPFLPDGAIGTRWAILCAAPFIALASGARIPPTVWVALGYLAVTLAWSPDRWHGADLLWHFVLLSMVATLAPANLDGIFWALGLGLAINSAAVMFQIDGTVTWTEVRPDSGLFFNRNQQNAIIALATIGLLSIRDWRAWMLALFDFIPMFTTPIQRGPFVALACAGAFLICRRYKFLIPAFAILIAGMVVHLMQADDRTNAIIARLSTWISVAMHTTPLGNGLGSLRWAYPEMEYAHNDALQVAYELGFPGLFCFLGVLCYIITRGSLVPRLVLIAFAVEGLFDFPLYQPATGFLAAVCAGHLLRARQPVRWSVAVRERFDRLRTNAH